MYCYREGSDLVVSAVELALEQVHNPDAASVGCRVLVLNHRLGPTERTAFVLNGAGQTGISQEDVTLLWQGASEDRLPGWLHQAIAEGRALSVNASHADWRSWVFQAPPRKRRVNVVGLGDVGGMLLTGLRLMGKDCIAQLGLYDPDPAKCERWRREIGQICEAFEADEMAVTVVAPEQLFDCDLFVFCASRSVPSLSQTTGDVRMVQLAGNAEILKPYAERAVRESFQGLFCVVSDPVDQLCAAVMKCQQETAMKEGKPPLKPDQIRGYGLGVMNGRACWYARHDDALSVYLKEGRAFGPHGKGLVIADSVAAYDAQRSDRLTELTLNANLEVREAGFKPFVAPALSSGALSLLKTMRGEWHYAAVQLGDIFMGCKNRVVGAIQETECLEMPEALKTRLLATADQLRGSV